MDINKEDTSLVSGSVANLHQQPTTTTPCSDSLPNHSPASPGILLCADAGNVFHIDDNGDDFTNNYNLRSPFKGSHHRRAFSDVSFQFPSCTSDPASGIMSLGGDSCPDIHAVLNQHDDINNDEQHDYDAFFSQYINVDNDLIDGTDHQREKSCGDQGENNNNDYRDARDNGVGDHDQKKELKLENRQCSPAPPPAVPQILEAKKAMSATKLAELWTIDPKRAKRIMANRQSAARSKERKARYISELERKVKALQTEATTLATQLNLYKKDVIDLAAENKELKLRLQTMEHQAQLQDDITGAMMGELERLGFATGDVQFHAQQLLPTQSLPKPALAFGAQQLLSTQSLPKPALAFGSEHPSQGLPSTQQLISHYCCNSLHEN